MQSANAQIAHGGTLRASNKAASWSAVMLRSLYMQSANAQIACAGTLRAGNQAASWCRGPYTCNLGPATNQQLGSTV